MTITETIKMQFGEMKVTDDVINRLEELGYSVEDFESEMEYHKSECDGEPSVYVGTYHKYNCGSLRGMWIDISSFDGYDEFIGFCEAIHADEPDPELMCQDYEGFPEQWYNEGFITREDFDNIKKYSELCGEYDSEAVEDYMEFHDSLDNFEERCMGKYDSEEDFARYIVSEIYDLEKMMGSLADYFDYERYGRELFMFDYIMGSNGYVFSAH